MTSKPETFMIFSYCPLIAPTEEERFKYTDGSDLENVFEKYNNTDSNAKAVLWTNTNDVVFLIPDAIKIAKHLEAWAEYDIRSWFKLQWYRTKDRYCLVLMPQLDQSVKRFHVLYKMKTGNNVPSDAKYVIVFKPIEFRSQGTTLFDQVSKNFTDKIHVGFVESVKDKPYWINNDSSIDIAYVNDKYMRDYLNDEDSNS